MELEKGLVIAFEGGEGSGKSTALPLFAEQLRERGFNVKTYAEPGGTDYAKEIRRVFLEHPYLSVKSAMHLLNTQRQDNLEKIIKPYVEKGYIVLIDRFVASTLVYQGILSDRLGTLQNKEEQLKWVTDHSITHDHVVFFFDCPPEVSLNRVGKRENNNFFDDLGLDKHHIIYEGYKKVLDALMGSKSFRGSDIGEVVTGVFHVPYVPGCIAVNTIDACDSVKGVTQQLEHCANELADVLKKAKG